MIVGKNYRPFNIIKRDVILVFLNRFLRYHYQTHSLWLISPWFSVIEEWKDNIDGFTNKFTAFIEKIKKNRVNVTIVTRPPNNDQNKSFIKNFESIDTASIIFIDNLHAKIYICENKKESFALVGSPNFTKGSLSNIELGILVKEQGEGKYVINELLEVCKAIATMKGRKIHKRRKRLTYR